MKALVVGNAARKPVEASESWAWSESAITQPTFVEGSFDHELTSAAISINCDPSVHAALCARVRAVIHMIA